MTDRTSAGPHDLRITKLDAAVPVPPGDGQPYRWLSTDGLISDGEDHDSSVRPIRTSSEMSFQVTFTNVNPQLVRLLYSGGKKVPRIPLFFPRMKYRARRRHLGYTRTGRRR